jgi:hypothetical protein
LGFSPLDYAIVALYLVGMMLSGTSTSSPASSTYLDLLKEPLAILKSGTMTPIRWSRLHTVAWSVILIGSAMLFTDVENHVVEVGLKVASFTYGGLLGAFLLGLLFKSTTARDGTIGDLL